MTILAKTEQSALAQCEEVIERGLDSFIEVGNALLQIREGRLYRGAHGNFEEYCQERWDISGRHAHRLIDSAKVIQNLGADQLVSPSNESQIRPLAKLDPSRQREVWSKAAESSETGKPTAKQVEAAVVATDPVSSKVSVQDHDPSDDESNDLWRLKTAWRNATKKSKAAFRKWLESENTK